LTMSINIISSRLFCVNILIITDGKRRRNRLYLFLSYSFVPFFSRQIFSSH
jgi:hypothetical protein